jgi:hypothetical protein
VTIDGEPYRVDRPGTAEGALGAFRQFMRDAEIGELELSDGRRLVVHWGRVTAVSVAEGDDREDELTYSGPAEPRWPQRPF